MPMATSTSASAAPQSASAAVRVPDQLASRVERAAALRVGQTPALRGLSLAMAKRDISLHRARAKSGLNRLKKQARTASEKRIAAAAAKQIRATDRQYRKASRLHTRGFWIPALIILVRLAWIARSAAMGMLQTCMRARTCTSIVVKGAEKVTAATVSSALVAGQRRTECFWHSLSAIPLVRCMVTGRR